MAPPQHVYETFIRATPAEVWRAITDPQFTRRYFHGTDFESELTAGAGYRYVMANGDTAVDGMVEEVDPQRRLVMTWHVLYDVAMSEEAPSRVEWVLTPANESATVTRVTVRHLDLGMSPLTSENVRLGWGGVLDSMKSLLETGEPLGDLDLGEATQQDDRADHRRLAISTNNRTWDLLGQHDPSDQHRASLLEAAMASAHHWALAVEQDAVQNARAAWLVSRSAAVCGLADLAMTYAVRCQHLTGRCAGAADFDRAYAFEALARANALAGDLDEASRLRAQAAAADIADAQDREIFEADLADGPWFGLERDG